VGLPPDFFGVFWSLEHTRIIRLAAAAGSSMGTRNPFSPSSTASGFPPTAVTMQGSLQAIASSKCVAKTPLRERRQKSVGYLQKRATPPQFPKENERWTQVRGLSTSSLQVVEVLWFAGANPQWQTSQTGSCPHDVRPFSRSVSSPLTLFLYVRNC